MPNTVILFDSLTDAERSAVYAALMALGVEYVTAIRNGEPVRFTESQIGAAPFRTAQAACVYAGLDAAARLDEAGLL